MRKLRALSALLLSTVLAHAPVAMAAESNWGHTCPLEKITHKLNLSAEQKVKVKAIMMESRKKMIPIHQQMKALNKKMKQAFVAGDKTKQRALAEEKKDLVDSAMEIREEEREQISNVLTESQRAKMVKMVEEWKMKHQMDH